jgi:drug/metabolite transporter (DMT)-like permease
VRGAVSLLGAATGLAAVTVLVKLAYGAGAEPDSLLTGRVIVAALVLLPLAVAGPVGAAAVSSRQLALAGAAGICFAGAGRCEFEALSRAPVAVVVLLVFVAPVWVALASWLLWRMAPGWRRGGLIALVMGGTGVLVATPGVAPVDGAAVSLALFASLLSAGVFLALSALLREVEPRRAAALLTAAAALAMAVIAPGSALAELASPGRAAYAVAIGALTAAALVLLCSGLRGSSALTGSAIAGAEPTIAALLSWAALGEVLAPLQVLGAGAVLLGVSLLSLELTHLPEAPPLIEPDRGDQDHPHDDVLPEALDAADQEAVGQHHGDEDPDDAAADQPDSACEAGAADHHSGQGGDQLRGVPS